MWKEFPEWTPPADFSGRGLGLMKMLIKQIDDDIWKKWAWERAVKYSRLSPFPVVLFAGFLEQLAAEKFGYYASNLKS